MARTREVAKGRGKQAKGKGKQARAGFTEKAIERLVGTRSFRLGRDYFESGAIFDGRRQAADGSKGRKEQDILLKAQCGGRSASSYLVSARVDGGRIREARCSCPVGGGGGCKHVGALLLAWLNEPGEFRDTQPVPELLDKCSKAALIELINAMLVQEPALESWLELALASTGRGAADVDSEAYRLKTLAAFESAGYGWEADHSLTAHLESLKQIGDGFRKQKKFPAAAAVYQGILEGFVEAYESFDDESGGVCVPAQECLEGLGACLPHLAAETELRRSALRALFDVLRFDVELGGIGLSDEVPEILMDHCTPQDRVMIAGWIRDVAPKAKDYSSDWRRKTWGQLLLELEAEPLDDEEYLTHCREFGLTSALVERLLKHGRLDEAMKEITRSSDYELLGHADRLVTHKHTDLAHSLVRDRWASQKDNLNRQRLCEWLKQFYASRKDWQAAIDLAVGEFRARPTLSGYQEIRKYAQKQKTWPSLRPQLLEMAEQGKRPELIRIYLDDGQVSKALELLNADSTRRRSGWEWSWDRIDLEVAGAAEKTHPQAAAKIYMAQAESLIAQRGRENYRAACEYLKKACGLYRRSAGRDTWQSYIASLRENNSSLRALHEELHRARL